MEIKKCTKCLKEKPVESFYFKNKKENKRTSRCKVCTEQNRNNKEHYIKFKDKYSLRNKLRRKRLLAENRKELISYLKIHHCVDCGEKDILVLEFDHLVREDKKYGISKMMSSYYWEQILKEISKCEVVCCNCHTRRTAKQFGWYKLNM